ncbi:pyruvate kinase [Clostridium hydrogenum]|uniref:pyruvate kinase n=1 Tax=Clostridium hydrogenum TaxID=2855764 RepID=UPI001EEDC2CE|nr:pyruvate kinase [Clostridium hydrogenum]
MQKTKMIFTIGPSSDTKEALTNLINVGMNAARLNFSHGTHESHKEKIDIIKQLRKDLNKPVSIVVDIKGPKIRTHNFENDKAEIKKGEPFSIICDKEILGDSTKCSISYENLYTEVKKGDTILVDDGLLEFKVDAVNGKTIECTAVVSGTISNHKGVNVPNVSIGLPAITEKDISDLEFACKVEADMVAASFIRKAQDIIDVKNVLNKNGGKDIKVIAKIETQEGVDNIDGIIEQADAIMVARGDMGVEIPIENVPIIQKMIIQKCNLAGKFVITATQMLDSMIRNPRPTRAEASDVANAIYDGTDAVMLSGESASGLYPIEAATTMSKIAQNAEKHIDYAKFLKKLRETSLTNLSNAISLATCSTAAEVNAAAIITATQSGLTAKMVSKYKPACPIIAVTPYEKVARSLSLNFGVTPIISKKVTSTDELIDECIARALEEKLIKKGDVVIIAAGIPIVKSGSTNMLKLQIV